MKCLYLVPLECNNDTLNPFDNIRNLLLARLTQSIAFLIGPKSFTVNKLIADVIIIVWATEVVHNN